MKQFFMRWYLLNKRLFKKPVFILILCIVPVLVLSLRMVTTESNGFVNITIALKDPSDPAAKAMADQLIGSSDIVHFSMCGSAAEAEDRVRYGETDAAWIISDDLSQSIENFVNGRRGEPCVTVIEREESVALKLSREKLSAAMSPDMCFELMRSVYQNKVGGDFDEEKLREHFDNAFSVDELFEFRRTTGEIMDYSDTSYLMLPIRGMLAVTVLLCGFAMAMFWLSDEKQMVFCRIFGKSRPLFEFGYHMTGILDICVIVLISVYAAGLATDFWRELLSLVIFGCGCAVFVILIRRLLRKTGIIAAVTPLIIILVIAVNPIIINLPLVYPLRVVTPVYWYLQSAHDPAFILYGAIYFVIVGAVDLILYLATNKPHRNRAK